MIDGISTSLKGFLSLFRPGIGPKNECVRTPKGLVAESFGFVRGRWEKLSGTERTANPGGGRLPTFFLRKRRETRPNENTFDLYTSK